MHGKLQGALLTGLALLCGVGLGAQDKPVKMASLPAPVQATVKAQLAQGAHLRGLTTDTENGQREYEAELTINGHHRDIAMNAAGQITEQEDTVHLASLPAAAQAALRHDGRVLHVERVTHNGQFVAYEAVVRQPDGKRTEVRVNQAGHALPDNG